MRSQEGGGPGRHEWAGALVVGEAIDKKSRAWRIGNPALKTREIWRSSARAHQGTLGDGDLYGEVLGGEAPVRSRHVGAEEDLLAGDEAERQWCHDRACRGES